MPVGAKETSGSEDAGAAGFETLFDVEQASPGMWTQSPNGVIFNHASALVWVNACAADQHGPLGVFPGKGSGPLEGGHACKRRTANEQSVTGGPF